MFLTLAALLLQVHAVPQNVNSAVSAVMVQTAPAAANVSNRKIDSAAVIPEKLVATSVYETHEPVAFEPGRLVPEPVPAIPATEPVAPALLPASPAPAAFVVPVYLSPVSEHSERVKRNVWLSLSLAQHSAATFDAWSTRRVVSTGEAQELNPLLRPFAGNVSLYAAIQVGPTILDYVGRRMMRSRHGWERNSWWIPQAVGTALSIASGVHNVGVYNSLAH